jgi:hypothetical protein
MSLDILLLYFAYLFTNMTPFYKQEQPTVSSFLFEFWPFFHTQYANYWEICVKFLYQLKYFLCPLTYCCYILHTSLPTEPQYINKSIQLFQGFCKNYGPFLTWNMHIIDKSMLKVSYHLKYFLCPLTFCFYICIFLNQHEPNL